MPAKIPTSAPPLNVAPRSYTAEATPFRPYRVDFHSQAESTMPKLRCKRCGALNPAGALWCGQCWGRFAHTLPDGERLSARSTKNTGASYPSGIGASQQAYAHPGFDPFVETRIHTGLGYAIGSVGGESVEATVRVRVADALSRFLAHIPCPHCGFRNVEGAQRLWLIRGFLIFARFGSTWEIGCSACLRSRITANLIANLLFGWWCFPWGLGTPIAVVQNLLAYGASSYSRRQNLDSLLREVGLGAGAEVGEYAAFLDLLVATCAAIAWADGKVSSEEIRSAALLIVKISDGLLNQDEVEAWVKAGYRAVAQPPTVSSDLRRAVFRCATLIAAADGAVTSAEKNLLRAYANWLLLSSDLAESLIADAERIFLDHADNDTADLDRARKILGVSPHDGPIAIKTRYRQLMLRYHPDRLGPSATAEDHKRAAEINWAYETLMTQVA